MELSLFQDYDRQNNEFMQWYDTLSYKVGYKPNKQQAREDWEQGLDVATASMREYQPA